MGLVTVALLTLAPLALRPVRLACLIHAANVHSEPGSNPSKVGVEPRPRRPRPPLLLPEGLRNTDWSHRGRSPGDAPSPPLPVRVTAPAAAARNQAARRLRTARTPAPLKGSHATTRSTIDRIVKENSPPRRRRSAGATRPFRADHSGRCHRRLDSCVVSRVGESHRTRRSGRGSTPWSGIYHRHAPGRRSPPVTSRIVAFRETGRGGRYQADDRQARRVEPGREPRTGRSTGIEPASRPPSRIGRAGAAGSGQSREGGSRARRPCPSRPTGSRACSSTAATSPGSGARRSRSIWSCSRRAAAMPDRSVTISLNQLMGRTRLSCPTVIDSLARLEELGLVVSTTHERGQGQDLLRLRPARRSTSA